MIFIGFKSIPSLCKFFFSVFLQLINIFRVYPVSPGDHEPRRLKELFKESLKALGPHKIRVFYLHAADRSVPFEDTVKAVHELFQEGHLHVVSL